MSTDVNEFRSGVIAIVGRPNVGKSTLVNALVGQKVSIVSQRPQTTRHRILGIKTTAATQHIYVDTPGLHAAAHGAMNKYMNRAASGSVEGVDAVVLVVSAEGWRDDDDRALAIAARAGTPVVLAINKIDKLAERPQALPFIQACAQRHDFAEIVPLSARARDNVDALEAVCTRFLPAQPALFAPDQLTDRSERFLVAELIREQVFRGYGQELPYATTVAIERFKDEPRVVHIDAVIWVEKEGQKAIVIGAGGERLKNVGRRARLEIQRLLAKKVFLTLWVKVREGWSDDAQALHSLGYRDEN